MQRDRATHHKYEISHLKRLAIANGLYIRTLEVITIAAIIVLSHWPHVATQVADTFSC